MNEQEVQQRGIHYECGIARFRETPPGDGWDGVYEATEK